MLHEVKSILASTRDRYEKICTAAHEGVYLYGAGFVGRWAVGYFERIGVPVLGFVDSDRAKWGSVIAGKPVWSPTDACVRQARAIVITSRHGVRSVEKMLAHVSAATLSVDALIVHRAGQAEFQRVEELLRHDERSLRTYYAVVIAMLAGTVRPLAPFADSRPFFERFGFFNRAREIFVDAGAYVGDSVERFLWSVNGVFGHIHAFEPGALQFQALEKRVARLCEEWALSRDRISLVQKGLSADSRVALVDTAQDPTQMQLEEIDQRRESLTTTRVETISLDAYFKESPFTFLKVDIEGSEADLLRGAKQSIAQHRPRVALSVYHYPTDIFELPVQLQELNQDYCFHLGHHSSQLMETVLYAKDRDD